MPRHQTIANPPSRADRLLTLARRCEQARASSQTIDEAIALEFGWKYDERARTWTSPDPAQPVRIQAPLYTLVIEHSQQLLPIGFWWRGGSCHLSSEVRVCPDHNDPLHRHRLMKECPCTEKIWDEGIEVELRPGGEKTFVLAFTAVCLKAHAALEGWRP